MTRLVFVGQAVVDHRFEVDGFSAEGGKRQARDFRSEAGGLATNAARAAWRLRASDGPDIALCAPVGDDAMGRWLRDQLRAEGLDVSLMPCVGGARTGVSAVLVDARGERQIHNFRGDAVPLAPLPGLDAFKGCRGLLADPRWPQAAEQALRWARTSGVVSVLDAEVAPAGVLQTLIPLADWVVFSAEGLAAWAADTAGAPAPGLLQRAAQQAPGCELIVTLGAAGLCWRRPDGQTHTLPAFKVPVVDTNGAGDVFHGALLLALAEGRGPQASVRRAMAAAALSCTRVGGAASAPQRDELDAFLEEQR